MYSAKNRYSFCAFCSYSPKFLTRSWQNSTKLQIKLNHNVCHGRVTANLPENLMRDFARFSCSPRLCISSVISFQSALRVASGVGHFSKNFHSTGSADLPGAMRWTNCSSVAPSTTFSATFSPIHVYSPAVLFRNMVATSSLQGQWKSISCTRL